MLLHIMHEYYIVQRESALAILIAIYWPLENPGPETEVRLGVSFNYEINSNIIISKFTEEPLRII